MALTKKERAERIAIESEALIAKALSYPNWTPPVPIVINRGSGDVISGWTFNSFNGRVKMAWWNGFWHESDPRKNPRTGGSRVGGPIFATELEATEACLYAMTMEAGKKLADVLNRVNDLRDLAKQGATP